MARPVKIINRRDSATGLWTVTARDAQTGLLVGRITTTSGLSALNVVRTWTGGLQ